MKGGRSKARQRDRFAGRLAFFSFRTPIRVRNARAFRGLPSIPFSKRSSARCVCLTSSAIRWSRVIGAPFYGDRSPATKALQATDRRARLYVEILRLRVVGDDRVGALL